MDNAIAITEQSALDADQISGDDIAQIRYRILSVAEADILNTSEDSNSGAPSQLNTSKMNISYSFVVNENHQANSIFENPHTSSGRTNVSNNTEPSSNASDTEDDNTLEKESFNTKAQEMLDLIVETAKVFNVKLPENRDKEKQKAKPRQHNKFKGSSPANNPNDYNHLSQTAWHSRRDTEPINEFTDMHNLLVGAFPQVFLFGKSYTKNPSLPLPSELEHLLLQYTAAAATTRELLFYLFDCKSCHIILRNIAAKVRKDPLAFQAYAKLVHSDEFKEKIIQAAADPDGPVAKEVLKIVVPVLNFGSHNTILGGLGDTTSLSRAIAMALRYGPATTMLTITQCCLYII